VRGRRFSRLIQSDLQMSGRRIPVFLFVRGPLRWSSNSRALLLLRSTACSGGTLARPCSDCDGKSPTGSLVLLARISGEFSKLLGCAEVLVPGYADAAKK
jgi:hypothetical protein